MYDLIDKGENMDMPKFSPRKYVKKNVKTEERVNMGQSKFAYHLRHICQAQICANPSFRPARGAANSENLTEKSSIGPYAPSGADRNDDR